jgi:hypothetical protein
MPTYAIPRNPPNRRPDKDIGTNNVEVITRYSAMDDSRQADLSRTIRSLLFTKDKTETFGFARSASSVTADLNPCATSALRNDS